MTTRHKSLVFLIAWLCCGVSFAIADEITVPLTLTQQSGKYGDYLSAAFDFGTAFSHIDSVKLQFVMPDGYEGNAVGTGNSFYSSNLVISAHSSETLVEDISFFAGFGVVSPPSLSTYQFHVDAGIPFEVDFAPYSYSLSGEPIPPTWPDFILGGNGLMTFLDLNQSTFAPLPFGTPSSTTTSWLLPGEIQSATLTIVATPVPEPASIALLSIGCLWFMQSIARRRLSFQR